MTRIKNDNIHITMCPFSSTRGNKFENKKDYPIKKYLNFGIQLNINSDDPAYHGATLTQSFNYVDDMWNLSKEEWKTISLNSVNGTFLNDKEKEEYRKEVITFFEEKWQIKSLKKHFFKCFFKLYIKIISDKISINITPDSKGMHVLFINSVVVTLVFCETIITTEETGDIALKRFPAIWNGTIAAAELIPDACAIDGRIGASANNNAVPDPLNKTINAVNITKIIGSNMELPPVNFIADSNLAIKPIFVKPFIKTSAATLKATITILAPIPFQKAAVSVDTTLKDFLLIHSQNMAIIKLKKVTNSTDISKPPLNAKVLRIKLIITSIIGNIGKIV
ncbi:hypothetical protein SFLOR_v1c02430 [Spiroplasma floricola 23-6]|uniref:Adenosine deaminase domain-containing protein n=1 Tax=Spiroplasma floricola 23-6 TaxID=1336749 RepID=A0A2K8SCX1_9MOLU|nr:hypothetical protein SFLOR_v1c02430 [Spiroplasma floricola 23-6]